MRSYRGLGDLPERLGMTSEEGSRISDLPFSEGQLLATIVDDWSRARCPIAVTTWGNLIERTPAAGQSQLFTFRPRKFPARIIYASADVSTQIVTTSLRVARMRPDQAFPAIVASTTGDPKLLEGEMPFASPGTDTPDVGFGCDAVFAAHADTAPVIGTRAPLLFQSAAVFTNSLNLALPWIVLPGQVLGFNSLALGVLSGLHLVWQEFGTNTDVLTSAPRRLEPNS